MKDMERRTDRHRGGLMAAGVVVSWSEGTMLTVVVCQQ